MTAGTSRDAEADRIPRPEDFMSRNGVLFAAVMFGLSASAAGQDRLQSSDLLKLRAVSAVHLSPAGTRVAYTVENNDGTGRPYTQVWVMTLADGKTARFG